jgi:hypothetical protein
MTKNAGEHWVCSVLSRYGWAAALTRDGLERTDILAVQTEGPRAADHRDAGQVNQMDGCQREMAARREVAAASALPERVVCAGHAPSR